MWNVHHLKILKNKCWLRCVYKTKLWHSGMQINRATIANSTEVSKLAKIDLSFSPHILILGIAHKRKKIRAPKRILCVPFIAIFHCH